MMAMPIPRPLTFWKAGSARRAVRLTASKEPSNRLRAVRSSSSSTDGLARRRRPAPGARSHPRSFRNVLILDRASLGEVRPGNRHSRESETGPVPGGGPTGPLPTTSHDLRGPNKKNERQGGSSVRGGACAESGSVAHSLHERPAGPTPRAQGQHTPP